MLSNKRVKRIVEISVRAQIITLQLMGFYSGLRQNKWQSWNV